MKGTRHLTAVVLLAAFGTVACSKGDEGSHTAVGRSDAAGAKPVATTTPPVAVKPGAGEDSHASVAPKITGSFADGEAAYRARKYDEAVAIFEGYLERRPGNAWGHYMLGLSAWKNGDLPKSEQAFDAALGIDPRHVKSLVNSSRVFIDQKKYDQAIERLARAAEIAPESAEVYRLLGRTHHAQGQTEEAVEAYRRAIDMNDRDVWAMNNLGLLLLETQRADEALPLFARAVELRKEVPEFHNNLGMALEHTGRFRAAADAYTGALAADPGYGKAQRNLARVAAVRVDSEEPFDAGAATQAAEPAAREENPATN